MHYCELEKLVKIRRNGVKYISRQKVCLREFFQQGGIISYPLIVGNWKMNLSLPEAIVLGSQMGRVAESVKHLDVVICPPSVYLYPIYERFRARPNNLSFGVQNAMWEDEGEFTGELSVSMVRGICRYVIIGHSERRRIFGETDSIVNKKVLFTLSKHLNCIVCVGEEEKFHLEDHYQSEIARMRKQGGILSAVEKALSGVKKSDFGQIVLAYEPVWAIGTGNAASGAYAAAVCHIIKENLRSAFGEPADKIRVLYGGSISASNIREFMMQPSIDGLLVGGASLKANEFTKICQIASEVKSGRII